MSRAVIVTPFGEPRQLAAACVLSNIPGVVVPVGDFSAIVQDGADVAAGNAAAGRISGLTGKHEVLLLVRGDEQIDAAHYRGGKRESDVPAGLALSNLPDVVESLVLGSREPGDVDGSIDTAGMSRMEASRATMTPARAALARTALIWMIAAVLALVVIVVGVVQIVAGSAVAWVVLVFGLIVMGISLVRIRALLAGAGGGGR